MFSSFSVRNFRIYWIGMVVSMCGTWIQSMAQNWLVFELSHSSFILGLVGFVSYAPILILSLFFGVLVDRISKRTILLFSQTLFMVFAFLLAYLTQHNVISIRMVLFIALMNGIVLSIDAPARQAMVVELVGKQNILNAIALNSIGFHSARMIGPAIAGILVGVISIAGCFYLNAFSFLAFIVALLLIRPYHFPNNKNGHFFNDLKDGLSFMKNNKIYLLLIGLVGIISIFGFSYVILLPVFVKTVLHLDVQGYGFLMSASGIGSLLGGLMLASLKKTHLQSRILAISLFAFSVCLVLFSCTRTLASSVVILIGAGFFSLSALAIINSFIQERVPDEFRGRIMSIYMITFAGVIPFGSLIAGVSSQAFGVQKTLFAFGVVCCALFTVMSKWLFQKKSFGEFR